MEEYNVKLLATKIYWDKPALREEYKKFWKQFQEVNKKKDVNYIDYLQEKQVLFLQNDLKKLRKDKNRYYKIIQFYQNKLVELGTMQNMKNSFVSEGNYKKVFRNSKKVR